MLLNRFIYLFRIWSGFQNSLQNHNKIKMKNKKKKSLYIEPFRYTFSIASKKQYKIGWINESICTHDSVHNKEN